MVEDLIEFGTRAGGPGLLAITLLVVFAESAILLDLVVPGEVGLVLAGAVAAEVGTPLWALILAAALGAIIGDTLGYVLGRQFGPDVVQRWRWSRRMLKPRLDRARKHFHRRGGASVAVARWVGALRAVIPAIAGAARFPYPRFLAWDAPSAIAWSAAVASLGYVFGDDIAKRVDAIGTGLSLVVVVVLIGWLLIRRSRHHQPARDASG